MSGRELKFRYNAEIGAEETAAELGDEFLACSLAAIFGVAAVADIAAMIALSKATMAKIKQNITMALGLKAAFRVTTVVGLTGLWPAIMADTGATVLVRANATRLLRWKGAA